MIPAALEMYAETRFMKPNVCISRSVPKMTPSENSRELSWLQPEEVHHERKFRLGKTYR